MPGGLDEAHPALSLCAGASRTGPPGAPLGLGGGISPSQLRPGIWLRCYWGQTMVLQLPGDRQAGWKPAAVTRASGEGPALLRVCLVASGGTLSPSHHTFLATEMPSQLQNGPFVSPSPFCLCPFYPPFDQGRESASPKSTRRFPYVSGCRLGDAFLLLALPFPRRQGDAEASRRSGVK